MLCSCVCVILPPVHPVCPNHEMAVFQPRTGAAQYLGSVASITPFILALLNRLFQPFFIPIFPSYILPPPTSKRSSFYHLSMLHLLPTSSFGAKRRPPGHRPHPPPASLHCLTLHPPPRACVCCRFPRLFVPPLPPSACAQVPVSPLGVHPSWVPPSPLCLYLALPVFCSNSWHLLVLGFFSGGHFCAEAVGKGTSTPWQFLSPILNPSPSPPLLSHSRRCLGNPNPPPPSPLSLPPLLS